MASTDGSSFAFENIELNKTNVLGTGSYGAVCTAKCDDLPCAAKLLYPVLFDLREQPPAMIRQARENRLPLRRFEQECQFLSQIRHPNIVQYLGTYHDPETRAPVLLMELMDESLTHFLENTPGPVAYHIQLNLSYDIALALSYLHSKKITHRDLSSNNVLLIAGCRAKVTDFGMSKLTGAVGSTHNSLTLCPGTAPYMAPEALNEPPIYTEKLDIFSHGVLTVQIITQLFPKPGERFTTIEVSDPRNPKRTTEARFMVSEMERRQSHIHMIPEGHPLLPTALLCLNDTDSKRPSANELCNYLEALKQESTYTDSTANTNATAEHAATLEKMVEELEDDIEELRVLNESEVTQLRNDLAEAREEIIAKEELIELRSVQLREAREHNVTEDIPFKDEPSHLPRSNPMYIYDRNSVHSNVPNRSEPSMLPMSNPMYDRNSDHSNVPTSNPMPNSSEPSILPMSNPMYDQNSEPSHLPRSNPMYDRKREPPNLPMHNPMYGCPTHTQTTQQQSRSLPSRYTLMPKVRQHHTIIDFRWKMGSMCPKQTFRPRGCSDNKTRTSYMYILLGEALYAFNSNTETWSYLSEVPNSRASIAVVDNLPTVVGGSKPLTNELQSLTNPPSKKWEAVFPPMRIKRYRATTISTKDSLLVAGGNRIQTKLASVEVMDIPSRQWSMVSCLPYLLTEANGTVCGDTAYIIGGEDNITGTKSVLKCLLKDLYKSKEDTQSVWQNIKELPVIHAAVTTFQGRLLAVGGKDLMSGARDTAIREYNAPLDEWHTVSHMSIARAYCYAHTYNRKLFVIGGEGNNTDQTTDQIEVATCTLKP